MSTDISAGLVRILRPDGTTSGTGFLVSASGLIATCSHVVQDLDSQNRSDPRPVKVTISFNATGDRREARVVPEWWREVSQEDVAILQLEGDLPPGIQPLLLGSSSGTRGHRFDSYGFPRARSEKGLHGYGTVGDLVPVEPGRSLLQLTSNEVTQGFSGAPVWDEVKRRVVGMVTEITKPDPNLRLFETAFATTTETLRAICSILQLSDICPYLGLSFFTELQAEFFFGRQQVVERLIESLRREPRFLAVLGPSGCGKSSVIRAKLIPELRNGAVPGSDKWEIIVARTADQPLDRLLAQGLNEQSPDLQGAVKRWQESNPDKTRLVLILDQFEETLVACPDQICQSFISQLSGLLQSSSSITLIVVMRDEFYSRFVNQAPSLRPWLEMGLVNVPSTIEREELDVIVQEPARVVGLEFETGLAEDCVNDVLKIASGERERIGQSTALPLLEFALTQLWERRREGVLTHDAYKLVGGVTGCLALWADQAYSSLDEKQRSLVPCILMSLVHLGNESQGIPDSKRQRPLSEVCGKEKDREAVQKVVEKLVGQRLLTTTFDKRSGQEIVDLIHDALIHEWSQFQHWLNADRRFLLWSQEVDEKARDWFETDPSNPEKREEGRLMRGRDLEEAEEMLKERPSDLSNEQREFVQRSLELRARVEAERAESERLRKQVRQRNISIVGIVVLAIAIILLNSFINEQNIAQQTKFASAERLTASSDQIKIGQAKSLPLAVALDIESLRQVSTLEAKRALYSELALLPRLIFSINHDGPVNSVSFSPNGEYIATASDDKSVGLWEAATGHEVRHLVQNSSINDAIFSPDGRYLASTCTDNTFGLWEIPSGRTIMLNHNNSATCIAFSYDSEYIAIGGNKIVTIWELSSGLLVRSMTYADALWAVEFSPDGRYLAAACNETAYLWEIKSSRNIPMNHSDQVNFLAFSPDSRYLATGSDDNTARLWNTSTGSEFKRLYDEDAIVYVSFSSDGLYLATASVGGNARVWDVATGREISRMHHEWEVEKAVFSPDNTYLATASLDGTARIWAVSSGQEVFIMTHDDPVYDVSFSPDGRYIATASKDMTARVWAATDEHQVAQIIHRGLVEKVLFSPNSEYIATASDDKTAVLRDMASGNEVILIHKAPVNDVAFAPNSELIATASDDKTARLWEVPSGRPVAILPHNDQVYAVTFSPDGTYLATGSDDKAARLWEVPSGKLIAMLPHKDKVHAVAFSSNGEYLATGSDDETAQLWNVPNGTRIASLVHSGYVEAVAFSPDSKYIATGGLEGIVRIWDVPSGNLVASMKHDQEITALNFSPNGTYLASASKDGTARLWDTSRHTQVALMVHGSEVWDVTFSPDGKYLATASKDDTSRVWEVPSGIEVSLISHGGYVYTVAFSPDGKYVATGSEDNTASVRLWSPVDPVTEACSRLTRNPTCGEWRLYLPNEPYRATCPNLPGSNCG